MASEPRAIELADIDDLAALVEEVKQSRRPRILRRDGEDVAILQPLRRSRGASGGVRRLRPPTPAEVARSRAGIEEAAGSWRDVDADALQAALRRQREVVTRPPVSL